MTKKYWTDVNRESLQGTYIITINEDCEIHLGDIRLDIFRHYSQSWQHKITSIVTLPHLKLSNATEMDTVNLNGVNLGNLKHMAFLLKDSEFFGGDGEVVDEDILKVNSVSLATVVCYLIFILIITFIIFEYKYQFLNKWRNHRSSDSPVISLLERKELCTRMAPVPCKWEYWVSHNNQGTSQCTTTCRQLMLQFGMKFSCGA